jgi:chromosome segregation protein
LSDNDAATADETFTQQPQPGGASVAPDLSPDVNDIASAEGTPEKPEERPREREAVQATLTKIRIAGFKSFAEPTIVEILPGLTGVVGPNGCGKSNVVEALRWAMGETSAKSMRGGEMDDVIFAGTANRPGRNIADVTLTLENARGLAPAPLNETAQLEILRRIERGAGSTYRVNGKDFRARDIQTMFADIGSGARASGMVSQGKVATLIQAKAEDRRAVLEEAAGISGLKARKHEAELKLRQAEVNLTRAEDLVGQLDVQRQALQKQARQANRYRSLSDLIRQAEADWLAILLTKAKAAVEQASASLAEADLACEGAEVDAASAAHAIAVADQAMPEPRQAESEARTALERRRIESEGLEAEERRANEALASAQTRLAQIEADLEHAERQAADTEAAERRLIEERRLVLEASELLPGQILDAKEALVRASEQVAREEKISEQAAEDAALLSARINQSAIDLATAASRLGRVAEQVASLRSQHAATLAERIDPEQLAQAEDAVLVAENSLAWERAGLERAEVARSRAMEQLGASNQLVISATAAHAAWQSGIEDVAQKSLRSHKQREELVAKIESARQMAVSLKDLDRAKTLTSSSEAELQASRQILASAELARSAAQADAAAAKISLNEANETRARLIAARDAAADRHTQLMKQYKIICDEVDEIEAGRVPQSEVLSAREELSAAEVSLLSAVDAVTKSESVRTDAGHAHAAAQAAALSAETDLGRLEAEIEALNEAIQAQGASKHPIAEELDLPEEMQAAVAAVLGDALESSARPEGERFWRTLSGYVEPPLLPPGSVAISSLVGAPPALTRAFSQIGLVESHAIGEDLQDKLLPGQCVVSRDGAVWRWDGHSVKSGALTPSAVRLQQRSRLRAATGRTDATRRRFEEARRTLELAAADERDAVTAVASARELRQRAEARLTHARSAENAISARSAEIEGKFGALAAQRDRLFDDLRAAADVLAVAQKDLDALPSLDSLLFTFEDAMEAEAETVRVESQSRAARDTAEAALHSARAALADLTNKATLAESRLTILLPQLERMDDEILDLQRTSNSLQAAATSLPDLDGARAAVAAAEAEVSLRQRAESVARNGRSRAEASLGDAKDALSRLATAAAVTESRIASIIPQLDRLTAELEEAQAHHDSIQDRSAGEPSIEVARAAADAARESLSKARARQAELREALSSLQVEQMTVSQRISSLEADRQQWAARNLEASSRRDEMRGRRDGAVDSVESIRHLPEAAAHRRAQAGEVLAAAEAIHQTAARALTDAEASLRRVIEARRDADARFASAREARVRAQSFSEQASANLVAIKDRIHERMGEGIDLPPADDLSDAAEEKAKRKADRLAREREEMGAVNLRAEDELNELDQRIGGITKDRDEIIEAIAKLRGSIGSLNREGRERLRDTFNRIDSEFRNLFGRLFGGGRAHLALVGSDDPLEAGLEIYAEPPGKKLSALSLLSGGEQALTALSLIFAVFRCQPAPVCVLDEVDAPLDDANVERLCDLLDHMASSGGTRFIIITHHPLSMARMDRLYGVTMQERGVSRLLSVDLARAVELVDGA